MAGPQHNLYWVNGGENEIIVDWPVLLLFAVVVILLVIAVVVAVSRWRRRQPPRGRTAT
jgi:uncharacterized membrane protein